MLNESRKILGDPGLRLASTCVRVPVEVSHCESVSVEFEDQVTPENARSAIAAFDGITLLDQPHESVYPMPLNSAGEDQVMVGRVRRDLAHDNGVVFWLAADNLRKARHSTRCRSWMNALHEIVYARAWQLPRKCARPKYRARWRDVRFVA